MLEKIYEKIKSLHWGAGLKAAIFALCGKGDPAVIYPAVRTVNGFLALILLGLIVICSGVVAVVLTGTFGFYSLERVYEIWHGEGWRYLWTSIAYLVSWLLFLGLMAWAYAYLLQKWIGANDKALLFWLSLCVPASVGVIALNLCTAAFFKFGHAVITIQYPYGPWLAVAISIIFLLLFVLGFAALAVFRFEDVFAGKTLQPRDALKFFLFSGGLFTICFLCINITGKSLEFVPGHPVANRIRAGELPGLATQIMSCRTEPTALECALVLWPKEFRSYTVYDRWDLLPLIGGLPTEQSVASPASMGVWRLYNDEKPVHWIHLTPEKPEDILLRIDRASACKLKLDSATAYRFDIPARATALSEKPRRFLLVSIVNDEVIADALKSMCDEE